MSMGWGAKWAPKEMKARWPTRYNLGYYLARIKLENSQFISQCWIWQGKRSKEEGRALVPSHNGTGYAARALWQRLHGAVPDGMDLAHICHRTECINPEHVRPVSRSQNVKERYSAAAEVSRLLHHGKA